MNSIRSANTICDLMNWRVNKLDLQKLLYIANLVMLSRHGRSLVSNTFEATDMSPVEPMQDWKLSYLGVRTIRVIYPQERYPEDSIEYGVLKEVVDHFGNATPGQLVAITHANISAWARYYHSRVRIPIPHEAIIAAYRARMAQGA